MSSRLEKFRAVRLGTAPPWRPQPILASPPCGTGMDFSKLPSGFARAANEPSKSRGVSALTFILVSPRGVLCAHERPRGPARAARNRHLHDVGQVRQLRQLPDGRWIQEIPGKERLHLRMRERDLRP